MHVYWYKYQRNHYSVASGTAEKMLQGVIKVCSDCLRNIDLSFKTYDAAVDPVTGMFDL